LITRYHFDVVHSTNDIAKERLHRHRQSEHLFAITASVQTAGRGRNGKSWSGSAGDNVYCSVGVQHTHECSLQELVTFQGIGCLAAKATCEELARESLSNDAPPESPVFRVKYPNDVYAIQASKHGTASSMTSGITNGNEARKICGVLVEHEFAGSRCVSTVIGIGLNVRQQSFAGDLARKASSLLALGVKLLLKQRPDAVFKAWCEELDVEGASVQIAGEAGWQRVVKHLDDGRLVVMHPASGEERIISDGDSITMDWQQT
jgi:biotin-(acetyl-CoA carboxylase) ligase